METFGFEKNRTEIPGGKFGLFISDGAGMGIAGASMGVGMMAQGLAQWGAASAEASARRDIAETNSLMMQELTRLNNSTREEIAQERFDYMTLEAGYRHDVQLEQIASMERRDAMQMMMYRERLGSDMRQATLMYNAQIFALQTSNDTKMKEITFAHEEKMAELEQPRAIDPTEFLTA